MGGRFVLFHFLLSMTFYRTMMCFAINTTQDKSSTPDSQINPHDPSSTDIVLTTWVAQPVLTTTTTTTPSATTSTSPEGVLLLGQAQNGKTRIMEQTTRGFSGGYGAIYAYNKWSV